MDQSGGVCKGMFCSASSARPANATRGEVKINSQSLEDTQVMYILQKYTLDKYTLDKYTLEKYTFKKYNFRKYTFKKYTFGQTCKRKDKH